MSFEKPSFSSFEVSEELEESSESKEKIPKDSEVVGNLESERQSFARDNEGLIYFVLNKFFSTTPLHIREDLLQTGWLGLLRAVDGWDSTKGEFSTFAVPCIHHEITRHIKRNEIMIRIPHNRSGAGSYLKRAEELYRLYSQKPGEPEGDYQLALFLGCRVEEIEYIRKTCLPTFVDSLDVPIYEDGTLMVENLEKPSEEIDDPLDRP